MKTIVIYCSKAGSTKKYAEDLAHRVGGEAIPLKGRWLSQAKKADTIVFGGWVMGGNIQGLNKFLAEYDFLKNKNIIVYSVGMTPPSVQGRKDQIEQNVLDIYHVRFYQLQGSFDISKLKFPYSFFMKRAFNNMANSPDATPEQKILGTMINKPLSIYDNDGIDKITSVINGLSLVVETESKEKE